MPTRRELEQLRKQRMSESQFAETFRQVTELPSEALRRLRSHSQVIVRRYPCQVF